MSDSTAAPVAVLLHVGEVLPQNVAQAPELGVALVGEAEAERARRGHGVQRLELGVGAQDLEHAAVGLP